MWHPIIIKMFNYEMNIVAAALSILSCILFCIFFLNNFVSMVHFQSHMTTN